LVFDFMLRMMVKATALAPKGPATVLPVWVMDFFLQVNAAAGKRATTGEACAAGERWRAEDGWRMIATK